MSAGPASPPTPDFSTKFWKEFRLTYPRPAVYIPVAVAYLLFLAVMVSFDSDSGAPGAWLAGGALLGMALVPCVVLARRLSGRQARVELREALARLPAADRSAAVAAWCWRASLRAAVAPVLALMLLVPLFLSSGWMILDCSATNWSALFLGLAMMAEAAALAFLSGAAGAVAAALVPAARAAWLAACAMSLIVLAHVLSAILAGPERIFGPADGTMLSVCLLVVAAICASLGAAALRALPELFRARLARPEDAEYSDQDALGEGAEGMGLGIAFWALFGWRFWADPFFHAERRSLWSRRRLLILWGLLSLGMVATLVLAGFNRGSESVGGLLRQALVWLPVLVAPAIMVVGLAGERASGAVESALLTPVAPLRLAAAKLLGRSSHLLIAAVILVLLAPIMIAPTFDDAGIRRWGYTDRELLIFNEHQISWELRELVLVPLAVLAAGAVGLCGAARFRSMAGALTAAYGLAAVLGVVLLAGVGCVIAVGKEYGRWGNHGGATFCLKLVVFLVELVLLAALTRIFLMSAARRLALQKDG